MVGGGWRWAAAWQAAAAVQLGGGAARWGASHSRRDTQVRAYMPPASPWGPFRPLKLWLLAAAVGLCYSKAIDARLQAQ